MKYGGEIKQFIRDKKISYISYIFSDNFCERPGGITDI